MEIIDRIAARVRAERIGDFDPVLGVEISDSAK
jgi:hypothetical protein